MSGNWRIDLAKKVSTETNIVKLNVGGAVFETSRSTLMKFDGFFKTMMKTRVPLTYDTSGAIFIDRDPAHFRYILNYMRDGRLNLPKSLEDVKDIQNEAQYYGLEGLMQMCSAEIKISDKMENDSHEASGDFVKLNIGGTIFESSKSTLTRLDGFFKTMLETEIPIAKDTKGAILIDRSAKQFDRILNYMRDGDIKLPSALEDVDEIQREAQYYLLDDLVDLCESELNKRADEKSQAMPVNSDIKVIETHAQYLQVITYSEKPALIIYQEVNASGQTVCPKDFDISDFLEEYTDKLDVYFKTFNSSEAGLAIDATNWSWSLHLRYSYRYRIFKKGEKSFLRQLEDSMKDFFPTEDFSF